METLLRQHRTIVSAASGGSRQIARRSLKNRENARESPFLLTFYQSLIFSFATLMETAHGPFLFFVHKLKKADKNFQKRNIALQNWRKIANIMFTS